MSDRYGVIYKITNTVNNKVYIGKTVNNFDIRYSNDLFKNTHNKHLKNAIVEYGLRNFKIDKEYAVAYSLEELDRLENELILKYKSNNPKYGYNKLVVSPEITISREEYEKLNNEIKELKKQIKELVLSNNDLSIREIRLKSIYRIINDLCNDINTDIEIENHFGEYTYSQFDQICKKLNFDTHRILCVFNGDWSKYSENKNNYFHYNENMKLIQTYAQTLINENVITVDEFKLFKEILRRNRNHIYKIIKSR